MAAEDGVAPPRTVLEMAFHEVVPLGVDGIRLRDARQTMFLVASARDAKFEGLQRVLQDGRRRLLDGDGNRVLFFPETLQFRVTASTRLKLVDVPQWQVRAGQDVNDYLLKLRFQLRIFRGLQQRIVKPATVEMVGMPAEVSYDERIYRVSFAVGQLPMWDRVVLEVISPSGERLSRFHLDLE